MKHEYTDGELAELKSIYDESGEAGLSITEMLALRKAGLLTRVPPAKPEEPSKRDLILAHCQKRIEQGQPFDGKETAEALGISPKTAGNILSQLRKEGLLPTYDKHSPRSKTRKTTTTEKKETMTNTAIQEQKPQPKPENPRAIIANALIVHLRLHLGIAACRIPCQRQGGLHVRHQAAERRIDGHQSQLQQGHEMRLNFNSKDGVFAIKAENKEEKTQLKTSVPAICDLIIDFFDAEVQEMKAAKE